MKKIYDFGLFLEAKKESTSSEVDKEVRKIISEMFAFGKNINFSGEQDGEPKYVEFEISESDYKLKYDKDMMMEYSEGVMKKRKYQVSLKFDSKSEEKSVYRIKFEIKLKPASEVKFDKKEDMIGWSFEEKPEKVIKFIKKGKQKCEWNESEGRLIMKKSDYEKLATDQLKSLINDAEGQKVRI